MRHRAVILKVVKHMSQAVEEAHKMVSKFLEEKTLRCPTCQTLMDADYAYCCRECYKKANSGVAVS
jgi:tRNA(Ile2) C34 agmatinyltransferase TiaS